MRIKTAWWIQRQTGKHKYRLTRTDRTPSEDKHRNPGRDKDIPVRTGSLRGSRNSLMRTETAWRGEKQPDKDKDNLAWTATVWHESVTNIPKGIVLLNGCRGMEGEKEREGGKALVDIIEDHLTPLPPQPAAPLAASHDCLVPPSQTLNLQLRLQAPARTLSRPGPPSVAAESSRSA